jgi:hypothetical protein
MNGKNRRTYGCWARGLGQKRIPFIQKIEKKLYTLPKFSTYLKSNLFTSTQSQLVNFFENYNFVNKVEEYSYSENTPYSIVYLRQSHFTNGTVRITKPGIYVFQENIVFNPNENNDFMPKTQQISSGLYPVGETGAYNLGFFAAITVETNEGVILDLNNKTITQSILHNIQQRFYAHIELAGAPFIPNQGPASFSSESTFKTSQNVLVMNGTLGLTSHHGIHGNQMSNIILQSLTFQDFEVAGIALNGAVHSILNNINILNTHLDVRILSSYSQARFIRSFLKTVKNRQTDASLNEIPIDTIISNLNNELTNAKNSVISGNTPSNLFGNPDFKDGYDGNVYGIVLNVNGVVINDFITTRPENAIGNQNIYLQNINIKNIISKPVEIIALNSLPDEGGAYGGKRQVGPAGDVFDISFVTQNDIYNNNVLSDSQLIIAKYNDPKIGTTNIHTQIVEWAENNTNLSDVMTANNYYFVKGGDSMGHFMKGNIGLFISAGENIKINNCIIDKVENRGVNFESIATQHPNHVAGNAPGGNSYGMAIVGSTNIIKTGVQQISNIIKNSLLSEAHEIFEIREV